MNLTWGLKDRINHDKLKTKKSPGINNNFENSYTTITSLFSIYKIKYISCLFPFKRKEKRKRKQRKGTKKTTILKIHALQESYSF